MTMEGVGMTVERWKCRDTRNVSHGALGPRFRGDDRKWSGDDNGGSGDDNGGSGDDGREVEMS